MSFKSRSLLYKHGVSLCIINQGQATYTALAKCFYLPSSGGQKPKLGNWF